MVRLRPKYLSVIPLFSLAKLICFRMTGWPRGIFLICDCSANPYIYIYIYIYSVHTRHNHSPINQSHFHMIWYHMLMWCELTLMLPTNAMHLLPCVVSLVKPIENPSIPGTLEFKSIWFFPLISNSNHQKKKKRKKWWRRRFLTGLTALSGHPRILLPPPSTPRPKTPPPSPPAHRNHRTRRRPLQPSWRILRRHRESKTPDPRITLQLTHSLPPLPPMTSLARPSC